MRYRACFRDIFPSRSAREIFFYTCPLVFALTVAFRIFLSFFFLFTFRRV